MMSKKPPKTLSPEARRWWRVIIAGWDIGDDGLMLLRVALEAFDRLAQAQVLVAQDGIVIADPATGRQRAHPALVVEKESRLALLRAWRQLGLDVEPPQPVGRPGGGARFA